MDRNNFFSETLSTLDLIFVPSSFYRWDRRNFPHSPLDGWDHICLTAMEIGRFSIEVGAAGWLYYYLSH